MTIDSNWLKCFKTDVPQAFTKKPPFCPQAVFIDGQIKLNAPLLTETQTWDMYIDRQFKNCIQRYLSQSQVKCVILAFDNYELVPVAKSMTQLKRRLAIPSVEFHGRECLPPTVPKGQDWIAHLSNRTFKTKLIQMIIYYLVNHIQLEETQSLIIDWMGHPKKYNHKKEFEVCTDLEPLGEADVKFCRYTKPFPKLQVDSIDGDSVPIAMLHIQNKMQDCDIRISILRMVTNCGGSETSQVKKRGRSESATAVGETGAVAEADSQNSFKHKREYEFLDVNLLYLVLIREIFPQCVDRAVVPHIRGKEVNLLIGLIGLAGTDFTRKIGGVSATTLYDYLPHLWMKLSVAYNESKNEFLEDAMLDQVLNTIYTNKFQNHVVPGTRDLGSLLQQLQISKLNARTKNILQSVAMLRCTVRNTNWLLMYWTNSEYPNPVQEKYGFIMNEKRRVCFMA